MRYGGIAALPVLLLAGCGGGGEDFTVEIDRPAAAVYAPLSAADAGAAQAVFPGIRFDRSRPSDMELLYTIPGTSSFPATVRMRLETRAGEGGDSTTVHVTVDAPKVRTTIDGQAKELSERKIERELRSLLESTRGSLEMGSNARAQSERLSRLLIAIAVATNEKHLARALDLKDNPAKLLDVLLAFDSPGREAEPDIDGHEIRAVDPEAAQRDREFARASAEYKQERALDHETAPTTDLSGYD